MKERLQGLTAGILIGILSAGSVAFAKNVAEQIEVRYNNIKVYKDNVLCELKDANGSVIEPFIYNGTTYMPLRGTANLADMQVTWDGATQSVYLWDKLVPDGTSFIEACPPYDKLSCDTFLASNGRSFTMAGEKYSDGITLNYYGAHALFNLNSKYSTIECTIGHTGNEQGRKSVSFVVDGKVVKEVELEPECLPKKVSIFVNYGLQLKIVANEYSDSFNDYRIGIGSMTVK